MLFLWSREPAPGPRAGPWFAWFATALVLWRCRRSVAKTILAVSPLRLLKRRKNALPLATSTKSTGTLVKNHHFHHHQHQQQQQQQQHRIRPENPILQRKHRHVGVRTKVKRLCTGDGPHVTGTTTFAIQSQQVHYKMTRSGKVYGKYPNKNVNVAAGQGNH